MSRAKGNRSRLKVISMLEGCGWNVAVVERTGRFIRIKDMFELFDLVAITEYVHYASPLFVQVATNTPHTHKKFKEFAEKYSHMALCV